MSDKPVQIDTAERGGERGDSEQLRGLEQVNGTDVNQGAGREEPLRGRLHGPLLHLAVGAFAIEKQWVGHVGRTLDTLGVQVCLKGTH